MSNYWFRILLVFLLLLSKIFARLNLFLLLLQWLGLEPFWALPDLNLPTDADGTPIDPNEGSSTSSLREPIESSQSVNERNHQLANRLDRIFEESNQLENETDRNRLGEGIEHLKGEVDALEKEVAEARAMDAHRADQLHRIYESERQNYKRLNERLAYYTLLNSWLRVLIEQKKPR